MDYTIAQDFVLPSKGLIYNQGVNPKIKIRSMTTAEEMKRLAYTETPYKLMSEIIDDCLVTKPGISAYDMCLGDYQFLLHRLRMVTYGEDYHIQPVCPFCGTPVPRVMNLSELPVTEYDEESEEKLTDLLEFQLPVTKRNVKIKIQTPRMLDEISTRKAEITKKFPNLKGDISLLLLVQSLIEKIDGEVLDVGKLETFVRQLPMKDTNTIIKKADKINAKIGIDTMIHNVCSNAGCGRKFNSSFRITPEFFGPSIDD